MAVSSSTNFLSQYRLLSRSGALTLVLFISQFFAISSWADIVVVTTKDTPVDLVTKRDVKSMFLGKMFSLPNTGIEVVVIDQRDGALIRKEFYEIIARKSPRKMDSYRARYLFTGRGQIPKKYSDDAAVINAIVNNPSLVGYIDSDSVTDQVKIIHRVGVDK